MWRIQSFVLFGITKTFLWDNDLLEGEFQFEVRKWVMRTLWFQYMVTESELYEERTMGTVYEAVDLCKLAGNLMNIF